MNIQSATSSASAAANRTQAKSGFSALGQGDFLRLMTEQLKHQDPFAPVDNKEMLAQMAQFSSLAGLTEMGDTLKSIASKLDAMAAAQAAAANPTTQVSIGS